jgi:hypothetical protein
LTSLVFEPSMAALSADICSGTRARNMRISFSERFASGSSS